MRRVEVEEDPLSGSGAAAAARKNRQEPVSPMRISNRERQQQERRRLRGGPLHYLSGESRLMLLPGAAWCGPEGIATAPGTVEMTNYQLRFIVDENVRLSSAFSCMPTSYFRIPLGTVASAARESANKLIIQCKDARKVIIFVETAAIQHALKLVRTCAFTDSPRKFFGGSLRSGMQHGLPLRYWQYDARHEYQRWLEGWLRRREQNKVQITPWLRMTDVNRGYDICSSYPEVLITPTSVGDGIIAAAASFRAEGRVPTLTWASTRDTASIWRASQPKVGVQGNINASDEALVRAIGCVQGESNDTNGCDVIDCRPKTSASANRLGGQGGYESKDRYKDITITFANVPNIHSVRDARDKLLHLAAQTPRNSTSSNTTSNAWTSGPSLSNGDQTLDSDQTFDENNDDSLFDDEVRHAGKLDLCWQAAVEDSKWLLFVRRLLAAAWDIAYKVHRHRARVLVHCSHGWDRTSQVVSLAQLLLVGETRTIRGFARLVEKDFVAFGHPFLTRCGHGAAHHDDQQSPIFLQWLDAVWQLTNQFPTYFEFDSRFLVVLADHVYSCRFPTFLVDTVRDRDILFAQQDVAVLTIWDYLLKNIDKLENPIYEPESARDILLPPVSSILRGVALWNDFHMRYSASPSIDPDILRRWLVDPRDIPADTDISDTNKPQEEKEDHDLYLEPVPHTRAPWVVRLEQAQREVQAWQRRAKVSTSRADRSKLFNMLVEPSAAPLAPSDPDIDDAPSTMSSPRPSDFSVPTTPPQP